MEKKRVNWFNRLLYSCALVMCSAIVHPVSAEIDDASLKNYLKVVDASENALKKKSISEKDIPSSVKALAPIKSEAEQCVEDASLQSEKLKADLASLGEAVKSDTREVRKKRRDLEQAITLSEKQKSSCRVLGLRVEDQLKALSEYQQKLVAARLLAQGPTIKKLLVENVNEPLLWFESISKFIVKNSGIDRLSFPAITVLALLLSVGFIGGQLLHRGALERAGRVRLQDNFSKHFTCNVLVSFGRRMPHLVMSLIGAAYFYVLALKVKPVPFISVVSFGIPVYFLLSVVIEIFLDPKPPAEFFHAMSESVSRQLSRLLKLLLLLAFIGYLMFSTILSLSLPDAVYLLSREIFVSVLILNMLWIVWVMSRIPRFENLVMLRYSASAVLVFILITELLGYRNLTSFIATGLFGTLLALGLLVLIGRLITELFDGLVNGKQAWQRKIRESLGVKSRKKLPELVWTRIVLHLALWMVAAVAVLRAWGLSEAGFAELRIILVEGFTVGSLKIIPSRIVVAIVGLIILLAISRWIKTRLERSWLTQTGMERGAREATATIAGYVGVAFALIISLSVAGVEFGNLAIIAGALSVGIGFGLQNVVNNFISGIILLFERPVKTGDWIVVGNTEGYVKKIRIRSTQIQTFDRADVIVPNSELISGQVTNWMLNDTAGRAKVMVGVAYGSDTEKVKELLQKVADEHPDIIKDDPDRPVRVLFMSFGESSLDFELRCHIVNIDRRTSVISDLNFAIDKLFREHNIEIPFPQRDVHLYHHDKPQE